MEEGRDEIVVSGQAWTARFAGGGLVSWTSLGFEMLDRAPRLELWRAPTDNDRLGLWVPPVADEWAKAGLHRLQHRVDGSEVRRTLNGTEVVVTTRVAPAGLAWCVHTTYRYSFDGQGRLALVVEGRPEGDHPTTLARIGLAMALVPALSDLTWYGLGPQETYPDAKAGGRLGRYQARVEELETPYVVPQENGLRSDVRWCQVSDGHRGLLVVGAPLFGFSAHRWSTEALAAPGTATSSLWSPAPGFDLDHRQQGLGSASCGPGPLERYVLKCAPFRFALGLAPVSPLALNPAAYAADLGALLARRR